MVNQLKADFFKTLGHPGRLRVLELLGERALQDKPARAVRAACGKAGIEPTDLDLAEINEAFAAVGIATARDLGICEAIINVNGGAIAMGHPLGMSGARITLHLALKLQRGGGGTGVAALCGGGGQGDALVLTVPGSPVALPAG